MFKLFIFVFCVVHLTSARLYGNRQSPAGRVVDTPGGNLTFQFDNYRGTCPLVRGYLVPCNTTLYEGRWYAAEVGFSRAQANNLACTIWDTYFDKEGIAHNFLSSYERGQFKQLNTKLTPVQGSPGVYDLDAGLNNNDKLFSTFYYMDTEMFVFWEVTCREGDRDHYRNIVIGYRALSMVRDKAAQLDRILDRLEAEGGIAQTTPIYHGYDCRYPARTTNPYR